MTRDKRLLGVIALSGALGLAVAPAGGQSIPGVLQQKNGGMDRQQPAEQQRQNDMKGQSEAATQPAAPEVKKVQEALKDKGHDPGPIDGVLGPRTQEALKAFQLASGLRATGRIDAETAAKLGVEDGPPSPASSIN